MFLILYCLTQIESVVSDTEIIEESDNIEGFVEEQKNILQKVYEKVIIADFTYMIFAKSYFIWQITRVVPKVMPPIFLFHPKGSERIANCIVMMTELLHS